MNRPLLRQKLALPPLWRGALPRERLLRHLDEAIAEGRHIGLFAGTGYGKSTLLAEWARQHPTVWLTLDAEDADLDMFLGYLIFAFEQALPGFTTEARVMLGRAREREGAQATLSALLADLDEQDDTPLNLVLDDLANQFKLVDPSAAMESTAEFALRRKLYRLSRELLIQSSL